jgi:hypothetical protein
VRERERERKKERERDRERERERERERRDTSTDKLSYRARPKSASLMLTGSEIRQFLRVSHMR